MNCMRSKNSQGSQVISFSRGSGPRRKWSAIGFWAGPGVFTTSAGLLLTDQQQLDELESSIAGSASLVLNRFWRASDLGIFQDSRNASPPGQKFSGGNRLWHRRGGRRILPRGPTDFLSWNKQEVHLEMAWITDKRGKMLAMLGGCVLDQPCGAEWGGGLENLRLPAGLESVASGQKLEVVLNLTKLTSCETYMMSSL